MKTLHIGLRVADRQASTDFYRKLGYEVVGTVPDSPIGHLTMMRLPGDEYVTLELVASPDLAPAAEPGLSHLVVATQSLDDAVHALSLHGIPVEGTSPPDPESIRTAHITDPDGNAIELVQWPVGHPAGMTADDFPRADAAGDLASEGWGG
ncbi:VOC family protein [Microbacterium sp. BK668]|uniref:VOC family protein n=1 Tax=Microbacterium sp. BK668 TaxID=2512118 RepID=UPI00105EFC76|nr:VOC family protein [Microbacterium sp. BK668]TDN87727.1 lactoylglutathione lyase [Microbacterium sp. BK668]